MSTCTHTYACHIILTHTSSRPHRPDTQGSPEVLMCDSLGIMIGKIHHRYSTARRRDSNP